MNWTKNWWVVLLVIVAGLVAIYLLTRPRPKTNLELTAYGGFAYVPSANMLEIAYLKATNNGECQVTPVGTELQVFDGDIVDAQPQAAPGNKKFDVSGAVITFADLDSSNEPLTHQRGPQVTAPPRQPGITTDPAQWADLKWVSSTKDNFGSTNPLNPQWRDLVDGRVVLTRGKLVGDHPDNPGAQDAVWDFKKGYHATAGDPFVVRQALTDRTKFTVAIPKSEIVINLAGTNLRWTRIVVKPRSAGGWVKLKLVGLHTHASKTELQAGEPELDYCQFYQLLQPIPGATAQLIPYYLGSGASVAALPPGTPASTAQPSPGLFCSGDWSP
jgi:hypothetical protein